MALSIWEEVEMVSHKLQTKVVRDRHKPGV